MTEETTKSKNRRLKDNRFKDKYFVGNGIDIGCDRDCLDQHKDLFTNIISVHPWDLPDGDAQFMESVEDNTYDFVVSSHCLEHINDPIEAFKNWIRICKPGGHIVITVPEEDLYEQGHYPFKFNGDHKTSWTIYKKTSWSPRSYNVISMLTDLIDQIQIIKIEILDEHYVYTDIDRDQTHGPAECAIEFIVKKL